jgi:sugar phosphate isomerase/epimerase
MQRRDFLVRAGGLVLCVAAGAGRAREKAAAGDRVGMGTVIFRGRFEQTKPKTVATLVNPLTLLEVPAYYRDRFDVRKLEFWSHHFESLDPSYLAELRRRLEKSHAELVNVQVDAAYDLANVDEAERRRSLETVRRWIDAAATLGSRAVRINPGKAGGSVEQSIASLKELNLYCVSKGLPLLTENHFGLEMDPDVHLRIREAAGPANLYTLPDFGNYPVETMWQSLAKIIPHAYAISAKAVDFNAQGEHVSYDFDRCVRMCESAGFKGVYLVEQWSRRDQDLDYEKVARWMLQRVRDNLGA